MHRPARARRAEHPDPNQRGGVVGLIVLVVTMAGSAGVLWALTGAPAVPRFPGWPGARSVLTGDSVDTAWLVTLAAVIAWLLLGYVAATTVVRAALLAARALTGGAGWVRGGLWLSELVTVPAIRRVVDGGVAGVLLLAGGLSVPARLAAAAPLPGPAVVAPHAPGAVAGGEAAPLVERSAASHLAYTVVPGDSLWAIAQRFYGDGSRYVELVAANRSLIADPRLIEPGWTLAVPLPVPGIEVAEAARYRVVPGDDLWSVAARFLGDGFRWQEIFELNRGRVMPDGRTFRDPNVINPGWVLELPLALGTDPPLTTPPAAPATPPAPTATPTAVATGATLVPTPVTSAPVALPTMPAADRPAREWEWPTLARGVVVSAAGFVVIGGAVLFVHRQWRRGVLPSGTGLEPPVGDAGRVTAAASALTGALATLGLPLVPALLHESRQGIIATVVASPALAEQLAAARGELARRLDCRVRVKRVAHGVRVTLAGFHRLAASLQAAPRTPSLIVPVGADATGIVYADLRALGGLGLALPAADRQRLVRAWVATLVTTHGPEGLALRADRAAAGWLGDLADAPHFAGVGDAPTAEQLVDELEEVIDARAEEGAGARPGRPLLALLGAPTDIGALLTVMRTGPGADVVVVAGDVDDAALPRIRPPRPDEPGGSEFAELVLEIPGLGAQALEHVHVRRDRSARWTPPEPSEAPDAVAGVAGAAAPRDAGDGSSGKDADAYALTDAAAAGAAALHGAGECASADDADAHSLTVEAVAAVAAPPGAGDRSWEADADAHWLDDDVEADSAGLLTAGPAAVVRDPGSRGAPPAGGAIEEAAGFDAGPPPDPASAGRRARARAAAVRGAPRTTSPVADAGMATAPAPVDRGTRQMPMFAGGASAAAPADRAAAGGMATSGVTVRCFGGLEILVRGEPLAEWSYHKAPELLAFMVAQGRSVGREQIANALWPELPWDQHVGHSLSNVVSYLRRRLRDATGRPDLRVMRSTRQGRYELDRPLFETDLDGFELALRRAASAPPDMALDEYERAFAAYSGEFLAGLPLEWAEPYRAEYRERFRGAARQAAALAQRQGALERAIRYYRLALGQEPTDEVAARGLMEALAASGDVTGARRAYRELAVAVQELLDDPLAAPDPETRSVLSRLVETARGA